MKEGCRVFDNILKVVSFWGGRRAFCSAFEYSVLGYWVHSTQGSVCSVAIPTVHRVSASAIYCKSRCVAVGSLVHWSLIAQPTDYCAGVVALGLSDVPAHSVRYFCIPAANPMSSALVE